MFGLPRAPPWVVKIIMVVPSWVPNLSIFGNSDHTKTPILTNALRT